MTLPLILGTATGAPERHVDQQTAQALAHASFGRTLDMETIHRNSGVVSRRSYMPLEWYTQAADWPARMAHYQAAALGLLETVSQDLLDKADLQFADIDMLITVSSTGVMIPGLDAHLIERLPFRRDVERLPIFGYGCAGGVMGLRRASDMARAMPGRNVLLLVVEVSSVNFRSSDKSAANFVSSALFADGAAAVLVRHDPANDAGNRARANAPRVAIGAGAVHNWENSLDVMGFSIEEDGFGIVLSPTVPDYAAKRAAGPITAFLAREGLSKADLSGYVCHPGGRKVLDGVERALGLHDGELSVARDILRDYGNMSAATVLFILERTLQASAPGRYLMTAFGPGFTLAMLLLEIG